MGPMGLMGPIVSKEVTVMPSAIVELETAIVQTPRVRQLMGLFDLPPAAAETPGA